MPEGCSSSTQATGRITVAEGASLDYETKNSYTGKVNWTVQGQAVAANLTINVDRRGGGEAGHAGNHTHRVC